MADPQRETCRLKLRATSCVRCPHSRAGGFTCSEHPGARRPDLPQVIERALAADVRYLIVTGLTAPLSRAALELARTRPQHLCCTAGVHPHNASTVDRHTLGELRNLPQAPEVVAIGECALDYDRDFSPRPQQRAAFEAQGCSVWRPALREPRLRRQARKRNRTPPTR